MFATTTDSSLHMSISMIHAQRPNRSPRTRRVRIAANIAKLPALLGKPLALMPVAITAMASSAAWQRCNRANVAVFASSYSVPADVRLVFLDEI